MSLKSPMEHIADLATRHYLEPVSMKELEVILQGASGRCITRIKERCIGIYWTDERADNMSFIPVAGFLKAAGVNVPQVIAHESISPGESMALVEDVGNNSLLTMKHLAWEKRKDLYVQALTELYKIHRTTPTLELQAPFDVEMYCWEQRYFAEHFVKNYMKLSPYEFIRHPICSQQAKELAALPRVPVHRDFQSQNVHIVNNRAFLIDFQGMRMGLAEYDLASLIYDPYVQLSEAQRADLLREWEKITGTTVNRGILEDCAIQRLMQAIGAFAKLTQMGNIWYESHIAPALESLSSLAENSLFNIPLRPILNTVYKAS